MQGQKRTLSRRARPRPSPFTTDLLLTAVVTTATLSSATSSLGPGKVTVLAALGSSVPVLWRRRFPLLITLIIGTATTGLVADHALLRLPYGGLVITYTIASLESTARRLTAFSLGVALVLLSLLVPGTTLSDYGFIGMLFATAYGLGTAARARRLRIDALQERNLRLERERLQAESRERTRIARDMHDVVAHSIGLVVVAAETGPLLLDRDPEEARATFDAIADRGRDALSQLRIMVKALRAEDDESARSAPPGLNSVPWLVSEAERAGLTVAIRHEGEPRPVRSEADVAAYRMIQESLTNVVKHARARQVEIRLRWSSDALTVLVQDDGRGMAPLSPSGTYGLMGMRERVTACGGKLATGSGPDGCGFAVTAYLPLAGA
jgi:signal transduction histidine kinase